MSSLLGMALVFGESGCASDGTGLSAL
jgi:hypothetical protein